jgi:hypothetical protein
MRILTAVSASRGLSVASEGVDTITLGNSSQDKVTANAPITASAGISGSIAYFANLYVNGTQITGSQSGNGGGISTVYTSGNIINSGSSGDPITLKDNISLTSVTASFSGNGANITNIATSNITNLYNLTAGVSASIDNNVVALWRFNETSLTANAVSDINSSYYDLSLYGTAITASGKFNNTRYLSNDGLFQRTGSEELGNILNSDWTLDGWFQTTDSHLTSSYIFWYAGLLFETEQTHAPLAAIELSEDNKLTVNAWKNFGIETNASRTQIKTEILPRNSWTHFAVVRTLNSSSDGISTGSLSNYKIYINGILNNDSSNITGTINYVSGTNLTHKLSVGNKIAISLGTASNSINGYLDDLRLSDVARTTSEVETLYYSSFPVINGLIKSGSQFTDKENNIYYNKGKVTIGGEEGQHKLNIYGSTYTEDLYLSGNATIGEDSSDTLTINSNFTANSPAVFENGVTFRGSSFIVTSSTVNFNTAVITASIVSASNIYAANELFIYGNTIQGGVLELTQSFNFNDLVTISGSNATFVNAITTSIAKISATGSFSGSYIGNGYQITNITASNIINFTNDVRSQFNAGDNITIVSGTISSTGGISVVSSSGNITGSGLSGNEIRLKDNISLTSISASTITSSNFYIDQNSLITGEIIQTDLLDAITISASVITASNFYIDQNTLITGEIIQSDAVEINTYLQLAVNDPLPSGSLGRLAVSGTALYFHNGTSWSIIS